MTCDKKQMSTYASFDFSMKNIFYGTCYMYIPLNMVARLNWQCCLGNLQKWCLENWRCFQCTHSQNRQSLQFFCRFSSEKRVLASHLIWNPWKLSSAFAKIVVHSHSAYNKIANLIWRTGGCRGTRSHVAVNSVAYHEGVL